MSVSEICVTSDTSYCQRDVELLPLPWLSACTPIQHLDSRYVNIIQRKLIDGSLHTSQQTLEGNFFQKDSIQPLIKRYHSKIMNLSIQSDYSYEGKFKTENLIKQEIDGNYILV